MKKLRLRHTTCFGLGIGGALVTFIGGFMTITSGGLPPWTQMASLALYGGMLLVLGLLEKGPENRKKRSRLLLLFFALLVANMNLPPLDWLWLVVTPCLFAMYRKVGDTPWVLALLGAELLAAITRMLALTPLLGAEAHNWVGTFMILTAVVRGAAFVLLFRRAKAEAKNPNDEVHRLR